MTESYRTQANMMEPAYLPDELVCPRHAIIRSLKPVLAWLRTVLPISIYEPVYDVLFGFYKSALRGLYFRKVLTEWLRQDAAALLRAKSVYNVMPYSLVGASGLEATFDAAREMVDKQIPGAFVECGVARGGCAALMATVAAKASPNRKLWLFDSFEGLPSPTPRDYAPQRDLTGRHIRPLVRGSCLGTKAEVESLLFSRFGFAPHSIYLVPGWFQDSLPAHAARIGQVSLLRIDGDWYESTMCCLDSLYDHVAPGGSIIVDDYGVCFGCKSAVHEFFGRRNIRPRLIPDGRGGVRFTKNSR